MWPYQDHLSELIVGLEIWMEHRFPEKVDYNHLLILQVGVRETNLVFQITTGNLIAQEERSQ